MRKVIYTFLGVCWIIIMIIYSARAQYWNLNGSNIKQKLSEAQILNHDKAKELGLTVSDSSKYGYYCCPITVDGKLDLKLNILTKNNGDEEIEKVWVSTDPKKIFNNDLSYKIEKTEIDDGQVFVLVDYSIKSYSGQYIIKHSKLHYGGDSVFK